jgi:uncharacterized protein
MNLTTKLLLLITGILIILGVYYYFHPFQTNVIIGKTSFPIEIAVTDAEKQKGLGYRESLDEMHGMVFPYDHKEQYSFWMKGMNFPLDFVWVDGNVIADLHQNIPVLTNGVITVVKPSVPVDKVIEFNAGVIEKYHINIGDTVQFKY